MAFLEILQNSQENNCTRFSFLIKLQTEAWNVINKGTPAQVFSCEFNKISKNIFFIEHLRVTASQDRQGSCAVAKTKSGDIHPLAYGHNT